MPKKNNPGCNCCATFSCSVTITVYGCSSPAGVAGSAPSTGVPLPGAAVSLTLGGITLGPTTTNGSGQAVFTVTTSGIYSVAVTGPGMAPASGTVDLTTCPGGSKRAWIAMGPDATHICCNLQISPTSSCNGVAIPTTLHLTSPFGTIALTYYSTAPFGLDFGATPPTQAGWYGCQTVSAGAFNTPIWWRFFCSNAFLSSTAFGLTLYYPIDASYSPGGYYGACPSAPASQSLVRDDTLTMSSSAHAASACTPLSQLYDQGLPGHFFGTNWPFGTPAISYLSDTVSL